MRKEPYPYKDKPIGTVYKEATDKNTRERTAEYGIQEGEERIRMKSDEESQTSREYKKYKKWKESSGFRINEIPLDKSNFSEDVEWKRGFALSHK